MPEGNQSEKVGLQGEGATAVADLAAVGDSLSYTVANRT